MIDDFKKMFNKPPKESYLIVRQGMFGLETYINKVIFQLNPAYRNQIKGFLKSIIEQMEALESDNKASKV